MVETDTRYGYARPDDYHCDSDAYRLDRCRHLLFGASKAAADVFAREYGCYFGMYVGVFCVGCLTEPSHSGAELHGFLSCLVPVATTAKHRTISGYKGKQVCDQIH